MSARGVGRSPVAFSQHSDASAQTAPVWSRVWSLLVRHRWWALTLWAGVCLALEAHGWSWKLFYDGTRLFLGGHPSHLPGPGGLHIYASEPVLQTGPLTFLAAAPLVPLGLVTSFRVAAVGMTVLGLGVLRLLQGWALELASGQPARARIQTATLVLGLVFVPAWVNLAAWYGHLDDALALAFSVLAVRALTARRPVLLGLLLGLAVVAKPVAIAFLPLVLVLPRRQWWRSMGAGAAVVGLSAAPFLLAAPQTLSAAGGFRIPVEAGSVLRLLGVTAAATPPWDRPVQLLLALALGLAAVRRGRWPAVLLLAVDARILLDPSVNTYYAAWLLVGTVTWDLWRAGGSGARTGLRAPLSLLGFLMLFVPALGPVASVVGVTGQAWLRAGFVIGSAVAVLVGPGRSDSRAVGSDAPVPGGRDRPAAAQPVPVVPAVPTDATRVPTDATRALRPWQTPPAPGILPR